MNLITPQEAEATILANTPVLDLESISLENALGRVLRQDLLADRPFPPFDRVTMDGIAFRSSDFDGSPLHLQGIHAAGQPIPVSLKKNHCWQIMTGAIMPPDCDTIIPYEEVTLTSKSAEIQSSPEPGKFIHQEGSDALKGDLILPSGTLLGPAELGILATIGAVEIKVTRLPEIKILTTGDELIPCEQTPLPHQLRQSNGQTLLSALHQWGPCKASWQHLPDELESTTTGIRECLEKNDLIILSGGISKGKKDYVRPALEQLCGPPLFHGVAQRPGKPFAFWNGIMALPGNPNSTLTTFHRYILPLLRHMTAAPALKPSTYPLEKAVKKHPSLTQYLPALINPEAKARALTPQNSGDFLTALSASGYLEIPPGQGQLTEAHLF